MILTDGLRQTPSCLTGLKTWHGRNSNRANKQTATLIPQKGVWCVYNNSMFNPNTTFNPAFPYAVVCSAAPHENSVFKTLDECWGLCLDLSEEYGHSEVWYGKCLMGEYRNGQWRNCHTRTPRGSFFMYIIRVPNRIQHERLEKLRNMERFSLDTERWNPLQTSTCIRRFPVFR